MLTYSGPPGRYQLWAEPQRALPGSLQQVCNVSQVSHCTWTLDREIMSQWVTNSHHSVSTNSHQAFFMCSFQHFCQHRNINRNLFMFVHCVNDASELTLFPALVSGGVRMLPVLQALFTNQRVKSAIKVMTWHFSVVHSDCHSLESVHQGCFVRTSPGVDTRSSCCWAHQ